MENVTPKRVFPKVWDLLVILILFLFNYLVVQAVMVLFLGLPEMPAGADSDPELFMQYQDELGVFSAVVYPVVMLSSLLVLWLYARLRGGREAVAIPHSIAGFNPTIILVGVLWLMSSQIILEPIIAYLPEIESPGVGRGIWAWVTVAVFAPILEELLCRGLIFGIIRNRWGVVLASVVSALFFGLIHGDPSAILVAFIAGLIFSVIYVRTSSIFSTMIIHSINNMLAFSIMCFGFENMSWSDIVGGGVAYYALYGGAVLIFIAATTEACFKFLRRQKS